MSLFWATFEEHRDHVRVTLYDAAGRFRAVAELSSKRASDNMVKAAWERARLMAKAKGGELEYLTLPRAPMDKREAVIRVRILLESSLHGIGEDERAALRFALRGLAPEKPPVPKTRAAGNGRPRR